MLVMVLHPHCPCSRASLDELAVLLSRARGSVDACVLFALPEGMEDGWVRTSFWEKAVAIPGVTAIVDKDCIEADRFGISTSGHVLLFGADGILKFSGGITSARGTTGPNAGENSILAVLQSGTAPHPETPVYGCPLHEVGKERP